ncbi:MAG TPA: response regulator transcription factor [Reyranellaceae bacterium]|nr:response regulator transcription factor [Reyranellaceae bacterium]
MKDGETAWPSSNPAAKAQLVDGAPASHPIRLLFVDDDADYREAIGAELADHGFTVSSFADGPAMMDSIQSGADADVILLDWSLPTTPGIDLLPQLRRRGVELPVVFLTGRATQSHENLAFDRGALDFVDKARGVDILAKRLRVIVESSKRPQVLERDLVVQCGRLVLKPRTGRAYWNDIDLELTLTEFNIVRLLASKVGSYVTYREIYDRMHHVGFIAGSGENGYRTNVRSSIKRIRNKFRERDPDFAEIENYPSFGYRWGRGEAPAA